MSIFRNFCFLESHEDVSGRLLRASLLKFLFKYVTYMEFAFVCGVRKGFDTFVFHVENH